VLPQADLCNKALTNPIEGLLMLTTPKILISTRFSFFGQSGWKSDFSIDPDMLFDANRLGQRFWLFENITLPSLASQSDKGFHYFILSSNLMPDWAKARLTELCQKHLGQASYTIRFARVARARKFQRFAILNYVEENPVAQVVLDDDDALSSDFVSILKSHLSKMDTFTLDSSPHFISFPAGYALGLRVEDIRLWQHNYKFINLGLTMIGTANQKNIFGISHKNAPKRFGYQCDYDKPMYIRTLSNVNDSHVIVRDKWSELAEWKTQEDIVSRFSWLPQLDFEEYLSLPSVDNDKPLQY
jgi:hypothetical protein